MTPEDALRRYSTAFMKARSNIIETGSEDLARITSPWLYGDNNVGKAIDMYFARGAHTISKLEVMNLLTIADRTPVLRLSCDLEGLPTADQWMNEEMWAHDHGPSHDDL